MGTLRALAAGLLGFAAAELFGRWMPPTQTGHVAAFFTVALGIPLVVAMIFIVAAEVLVPSGTGPQPVEVVRNARRALARSRRYSQISRIAVQHGLGPYLRGRRLRPADAAGGRAALAASLRSALEAGGATFTKLGQLLSTRHDLLPAEFTAELARLQDRAEPAHCRTCCSRLGRGDPAALRALATLEGTLSELQPDFDIVSQARDYAATHVTAQLTPKTVQETAADELLTLVPVLRRLPRRLDRISGSLEQGRLGVNVRLFADERDRRVASDLTSQFLLTFLGAATGIMAALLLGVMRGPRSPRTSAWPS